MISLKASTVLGMSGSIKSIASVTETSGSSDVGIVPVLDFEEKLAAKEKEFVTAEEKAALVYPAHDLTISKVPRLNSGSNSIFLGDETKRAEGYVGSVLDRFSRDYVTIAAHSDEHSGRTLAKKPLDWTDAQFAPAVSVNDPVQAPAALDESILENSSSKLGKVPKSKKAGNIKQPSLFSACALPASPSDTRPVADLPRATGLGDGSTAQVQALVHIKEIRFVGAGKLLEPLFLSVCAFNVRKRERITETIHVFENLNAPEIVLSLGERVSGMAPELRAQRALFPLDEASPDVFLVFFLEKTLRGATCDESLDELLRAPGRAGGAGRAQDEARVACARLGGLRQPLAWAARRLFEKGRSLLGADVLVDGFVRLSGPRAAASDAQIVAQLERIASGGGSAASVGAEQVVLDFDLVPTDRVLPHLVLPSLELAAAGLSLDARATDPSQLVRVAQHFTSPDSISRPWREACNDLFVYMDWANFSKAHRRIKTVAIRVSLHENDDSLGQQGLPVFYGRFSGRFDRESVCSVQYHERRLSMYDQIKIRLPAVLRPGHHLLFTFSHVQCNLVKLKRGDPVETVFGYSCLPLCSDSRVLPDGSYELSVSSASSFPRSHYLGAEGAVAASPASSSPGQHDDGDAPMFGLHTRLISSVLVQDAELDAFLRLPPSSGSWLERLARASAGARVRNLPALFDRLWRALAGLGGGVLSQAAALAELVSSAAQRGVRSSLVHQEHRRNPDLVFYVQFEFDENPDDFDVPVFESVLEALLEHFRKSSNPTLMATHLWFFFDVAFKSLVINVRNVEKRRDRVTAAVMKTICDLIALLSEQIVLRSWITGPLLAEMNDVVSFFIKDLLHLLDRGQLLNAFQMHLSRLSAAGEKKASASLFSDLIWRSLRIVCDHPHFVPLCVPSASTLPTLSTHVLSGLLARHLAVALTAAGSSSSTGETSVANGAAVLRELLRKHENDVRLSERSRVRAARLHWTSAAAIAAAAPALLEERVTSAFARDLAASFLWIVRSVSRKNLLVKWWAAETSKMQESFLHMLQACLKVFSGQGSLSCAAIRAILSTVVGLNCGGEAVLVLLTNLLREFVEGGAGQQSQEAKQDAKLAGDATLALEVLSALRGCVMRNAVQLFGRASPLCGDLALELLQAANLQHGPVRASAAALLFLLMKLNYSLKGNFTRMKLQATIAVSRLSGNLKMEQTHLLASSLEAVAERARREVNAGPSFAEEASALTSRLYRVMEDSAQIRQGRADPERTAELMLAVARGYRDSPALRMAWLSNLASWHRTAGNADELAQCCLLRAALVAQRLRDASSNLQGIPDGVSAFVGVCPSVMNEPVLSGGVVEEEEGEFEERDFSPSGLERLLRESLTALRPPARHELAIRVLDMLVDMHQGKYSAMGSDFAEMGRLSKLIVEADAVGSRSFSAFYRVSFFGHRWGPDLDGKSFIYKTDEFTHIAEVTDKLEKQFRAIVLQVERLGNKEIQRSELLPDMCYWQIGAVKEYFEEHEVHESVRLPPSMLGRRAADLSSEGRAGKRGSLLEGEVDMSRILGGGASLRMLSAAAATEPVVSWERRVTRWERKFNVSRFIMIQPFTKGGQKKEQSEGRPEDQWTRKTIFTTQSPFPCLNTRSLVVSQQVIELTPLETATEQILDQTKSFLAETQRSPPVLNQLQRVVQGAVLTQVNVGVVHTARVLLLGDQKGQHPPGLVLKMVGALKEFLLAAEAAVALNKVLVGSEQQELQEAFDKGLAQMKEQLEAVFQQAVQ